jgi:hypothetical protein
MMSRSIGGYLLYSDPVAKTARRMDDVVKTTVELPADLWRAAKIRAMDERIDLRSVLILALERFLEFPESRASVRNKPR